MSRGPDTATHERGVASPVVVGLAGAEVSVVVLTYNSEATIAATLESAARLSADIHVVDSFSTDATVDVATREGVHLVQHPFASYGAQRNWAIDTLPLRGDWELHLDADERLSDELVAAIRSVMANGSGAVDGYYVPRLVRFMGREIRHGGMYPIWHMRLFRRGQGRCENRRYDQHFYVEGATGRLPHPLIDDIRMSVGEFVSRHDRWADAEAEELCRPSPGVVVGGRLRGNPVERKRYLRGVYNRMPLFVRAFALFVYRYVVRLGFLDGREGLVFFTLQTLVYRLLVDARLYERRRQRGGALPG
jgi:glycosyltransferase involved in cell wall biosynthesis